MIRNRGIFRCAGLRDPSVKIAQPFRFIIHTQDVSRRGKSGLD
jgi:hypothetical protein